MTQAQLCFQSLLHGSPEAKKAGEIETQQHSRLIGRGKYIHAFESAFWLAFDVRKIIDAPNSAHRVKPDRTDEYKKAACVPFFPPLMLIFTIQWGLLQRSATRRTFADQAHRKLGDLHWRARCIHTHSRVWELCRIWQSHRNNQELKGKWWMEWFYGN